MTTTRSKRTNIRVGQELALSEQDQYYLDQFNRMLDLVRDRALSVAMRYQVGCYIVGRAGTSKTYSIQEELKRAGTLYTYRNARMTAPGLWALLQEHPEHTIVLDDIPSLVQERAAQQILLAALNGEPTVPRLVTYTTKEIDGRRSFEFSGGIIAISNVPLRRDPLADAVASRVPILEHEPSDEMIAAFMRWKALKGFSDLTAAECLEVVEFVINESRACDYRLDLRAMVKSWNDYRLWKHGEARCPWQILVASNLKKLIPNTGIGGGVQRTKIQQEKNLATELFAKYPNRKDKKRRDEEWNSRTGKSPDMLYRHRREVEDKSLL